MIKKNTDTVRSRADMIRIPLGERRSKEGKSLVKIVHTEEADFLSEWSFEDIKAEPFGIVSKRPMVYMTDDHEVIEKSLWCYERGMVPLAGETDPEISSYAAGKYQIDQLITDPEACQKILPYLSTRTEPLLAISILSSAFRAASLLKFLPFAQQVRLVLTLPETGVIAEAPLSSTPVFSVAPESHAVVRETLIITKRAQLVTPITDYDTGIHISVRSRHDDESVESFAVAEK